MVREEHEASVLRLGNIGKEVEPCVVVQEKTLWVALL